MLSQLPLQNSLMIQQWTLTVSSIIRFCLEVWRRTKSILLLGLLFPLGHIFQYRKYVCNLLWAGNADEQASKAKLNGKPRAITMQAALHKILTGKHDWFPVTLKTKQKNNLWEIHPLEEHSQHSQQKGGKGNALLQIVCVATVQSTCINFHCL